MATNFTPGPWVAVRAPGDPEGRVRDVKKIGRFAVIAKVQLPQLEEYETHGGPEDSWHKCNEIASATASLIAAAPDLYTVCAEIREAFSYFSEWDLPIGFEDRLNAALKKAEGEND